MARTRMLTIRVDDEEHALFKGAAVAARVSISVYARDAMLARMALEQAPVVASPPVVLDELKERVKAMEQPAVKETMAQRLARLDRELDERDERRKDAG